METNYEMNIKIFKQFHKNVIGRNGSTIRKIKEETGTRIELPEELAESDVIRIIGHRKGVELAAQRVETIQRELAHIMEVEVHIPQRLHTAVIGPKGRFIQQLQDECGGVQVRFPTPDQVSEVVRIRGPKNDVEKACCLLKELVAEKREATFERTVSAKPEFHKFLIGRRGVNIEELRKQTQARVVFPELDDDDKETITIIGDKDAVMVAEKRLLESIRALENVIEEEVYVDSKWHKHFLQRRGELLNVLSKEYGGVVVSFPKGKDSQHKVRVKGPCECVAGAIKRLLEMVDELKNEVTLDVVVPQKHHKALIGRNGRQVQAIRSEYNVGIKFPSRDVTQKVPIISGNTGTTNGATNGQWP